jgi:hypothetical protein
MDDKEILEFLNALYVQQYHPHSGLDVERVDICDGRYYAVHPDSNVISLFPDIDRLVV